MQLKNHLVGNVNIIELSGSFDAYNAPAVRQWFENTIGNNSSCIIVNLKEVSFMDSTGLSTLVQALKRTRNWQGDLRLCCLQQPVRIIFELTRLDRVFEIYNDEMDAVRAFTDYINTPSMDDAASKQRSGRS